jgi:uncharacterized protein YndB with AHSA1/START domain
MSITDAGVVGVSRALPAPPDAAFAGWIDSALAARWLFATPGGRIVRCEIDARPGGAFVITDRRDGEDVEHVGVYVEVDRPRRLLFRFKVPKYSSEESTVEVRVEAADSGALVTIETFDVPPEWREQTEQGWRELLERLEALLRQG